jgi:hypothetical protein
MTFLLIVLSVFSVLVIAGVIVGPSVKTLG